MRTELEGSLGGTVDFCKDPRRFPVKKNCLYLANCAIGPMYHPCLKKIQEFLQMQSDSGLQVADHYGEILSSFREKTAHLLKTETDNIAYVSNTATGINILANGDYSGRNCWSTSLCRIIWDCYGKNIFW